MSAPVTPGSSPRDDSKRSTRPTDPPFAKACRIAIIGAGPAGLTMAYELQKRGYTRVDVYEKASRVGGMTYTHWDTAPLVDHNVDKTNQIKVVPHEIGACYLTAIRHRYILDIMEEVYLETVPMPSMEVYSGKPQDKDKVVHFEDWMQTTYRGATAELAKWPGLKPDQKAKLFLGQLNEYFVHRERLLGDNESYLFPRDRPSKAALQELGMPFKKWLEHHGLHLIVPLFYETQTSQGYGYLEEVPTYYALIWNSKELFSYINLHKIDFFNLANSLLKEFMEPLRLLPHRVKHQIVTETPTPGEAKEGGGAAELQNLQKSFRAQMVQGGFMTIWERLVKKLPNVHKNVNILKVDRRKDDPKKPILITYTMGDDPDAERVTAQHDYLMLACKLDDVDWLDTQNDERAIFTDILNYELTTTLVRIPAHAKNVIPTTPHMFLADKLLSTKDVNRCYVTRTSLQCVSPGMSYGKVGSGAGAAGPTWRPNDDTRVCFQYSGIDSTAAKKLSNDDLYKQLEKDLKEYGAQEVKPHRSDDGAVLQERWKYMPHFKGEKLGRLWDLWELQNTHRTFYLGSLTCFESTADVHSYNKQLVDYYQL